MVRDVGKASQGIAAGSCGVIGSPDHRDVFVKAAGPLGAFTPALPEVYTVVVSNDTPAAAGVSLFASCADVAA